jgi:hypothetical protein
VHGRGLAGAQCLRLIPTVVADTTSPAVASPVHDAFISYSRKDKEFARKLDRALKAYTPPRALDVPQRHLDVFRDEEDFTGADYHASIARPACGTPGAGAKPAASSTSHRSRP